MLYYLCSENKGADQLCGCFRIYAERRFSHDTNKFHYIPKFLDRLAQVNSADTDQLLLLYGNTTARSYVSSIL